MFHTLAVPLSVALIVVAFYLRGRRRRRLAARARVADRHRGGRAAQGPRLRGGDPELVGGGAPLVGTRSLLRSPPASRPILALAGRRHHGRGRFRRPAGVERIRARGARRARSGCRRSSSPQRSRGCSCSAYLLFRPLARAAATCPAEPRRAAADARARARARHARVLQAAPRQALPLQPDRTRVRSATASRTACCWSRAIRSAPPEALPELVRETCAFAERAGCASARSARAERSRALSSRPGCASLYLGDEAIVETRAFSLEGRAIRKVRQSVTPAREGRLPRTSCATSARLDARRSTELERRLRALARRRARARLLDGDGLAARPAGRQSVVVAARDGDGRDPRLPPLRARPTAGRRCRCRSCGATATRRTA